MTVDAALYIGSIDETLPLAADFVYEGDDQIRATKKAVRQSFPMVTGPVLATHTELSYAAGVISPVQAQLTALALSFTVMTTGLTQNLIANGFRITGLPTPLASSEPATKGYADGLVFAVVLPSQASGAGLELTTDGTTAGWGVTAPGAMAILNFIGY